MSKTIYDIWDVGLCFRHSETQDFEMPNRYVTTKVSDPNVGISFLIFFFSAKQKNLCKIVFSVFG